MVVTSGLGPDAERCGSSNLPGGICHLTCGNPIQFKQQVAQLVEQQPPRTLKKVPVKDRNAGG